MTKESQRSRLAGFRGRVEQTGHPKTGMALLRQNPGPFLRLERDAVGAMKARGNETDPFRRPGAEGDGTHAASTLAARAAMQTEKFPGLGVGLHLGASVASESWLIFVPRFVAPHDDKPRVSARGVAAEHAHVFVDRLMRTAGQLTLVVEPDLGIRWLEQLEFHFAFARQMQPGDFVLRQCDGLTFNLAVVFPAEDPTQRLAQLRAYRLARRVIRLVGVRPANELDVKSHLLSVASPKGSYAGERQDEDEHPEEFR